MPTVNRVRIVGGIVVATAALSGCSSSTEAQRDSSSGEVTASVDADVFSIEVGDCLDMASQDTSGEVESLPTVPCADEHDAEVYAEMTLSGDEYPDDVEEQAQQYCGDEFASYVGLSYDASSLDILYLYPTQDTWDYQDDREIQCIVVSEEYVTETLANSAL